MQYPRAISAALSVMLLSLAPLAPAMAAGPAHWGGAHAFGHFGLGAVFAHTFFGLATLPLAIIGAAVAAQAQDDRGYAPEENYGPAAGYAPPNYYPAPNYYQGPNYYQAPRAYYAAPPAAYYAPRPVYYPPGPGYYAPPVSYYGRPAGYYGARPGYYAPSGYQAARRSGYYHYPR
jgi:hypothetical protein